MRSVDDEQVCGAGHPIQPVRRGEHHVAVRPEEEAAAIRGELIEFRKETARCIQVIVRMEIERADLAAGGIAQRRQAGENPCGLVEAGREQMQMRGVARRPAGQVVGSGSV